MPSYNDVISSKFPKVGSSIFSDMSSLSREYNALNLAQGFPSFDVDSKLIQLVNKYMKKGMNQYTPLEGVPELRRVISEKTEKLYGTKYDPETEICITAGATQAIFTVLSALLREEDEVIMFAPAYDNYAPSVEMVDAKPIFVGLKGPTFRIDWEEVKKKITRKTKMIIINSPQNPTGSILSKNDIEELEKLSENSGCYVLSDEVYEHIIFDGNEHESAAKYPKLAERSFVLGSFGKTFHNTGWRLGYCMAPAVLMAEFKKLHQYVVFTANTPMQYALAEYLEDEQNYLSLGEFYQTKRDYFIYQIHKSRFKILPCKGSYFQLLDYSEITSMNDREYAIELTKNHGIATIPLTPFHGVDPESKILRFCFAKTEAELEKAGKILCNV